MTCPICDNKAANCDCSSKERSMYYELEEAEEENDSLRRRITELEATIEAMKTTDDVLDGQSRVEWVMLPDDEETRASMAGLDGWIQGDGDREASVQ